MSDSRRWRKKLGRAYTAAAVVVAAQSRGYNVLDVLCDARVLGVARIVDGHVSGAASTSCVDGALEGWDFEVLLRLLISIGGFPEVTYSSAAFPQSASTHIHTSALIPAFFRSGFRI
jgi:hypothetical protein